MLLLSIGFILWEPGYGYVYGREEQKKNQQGKRGEKAKPARLSDDKPFPFILSFILISLARNSSLKPG